MNIDTSILMEHASVTDGDSLDDLFMVAKAERIHKSFLTVRIPQACLPLRGDPNPLLPLAAALSNNCPSFSPLNRSHLLLPNRGAAKNPMGLLKISSNDESETPQE